MENKKKESIWKKFVEKLTPKDAIGGFMVIYGMYLIGQGINGIVSGLVIGITTYYFSKRIYEENNGRK